MRYTKVGAIYEKEKEEAVKEAVEKAIKRVKTLMDMNLYAKLSQESVMKVAMAEPDEESNKLINIIKSRDLG